MTDEIKKTAAISDRDFPNSNNPSRKTENNGKTKMTNINYTKISMSSRITIPSMFNYSGCSY